MDDLKELYSQASGTETTKEETTEKEEVVDESVEVVSDETQSDELEVVNEDEKVGNKKDEKSEEANDSEKDDSEAADNDGSNSEGVVSIDEKTDINTLDISEKTNGEFKSIDELLESYNGLKEKTKPVENVFEYLNQQSEEKIGLNFSELMEYKSMNFDEMNEFDILTEYEQFKDPDVSEIEIKAELKQYEILNKSEEEIKEMIEEGELTQADYDLTKAKFNKQVRVARRELNNFRDSLDLDNIELPVNIQEEKKQELTQEQIEENAKVIREELNSLKTLRLSLGLDGKENPIKLDFKTTEQELDMLADKVKNPQWLLDRWKGEDGQVNKQKAYTDAYILNNVSKMVKTAYNEGLSKGRKQQVVDEDNLTLGSKQKSSGDVKTNPYEKVLNEIDKSMGY